MFIDCLLSFFLLRMHVDGLCRQPTDRVGQRGFQGFPAPSPGRH
jgi:hypothetical protein